MTGRGLLVVAGESSGDLHGARLLAELRKLVPDVLAFGMGGERLAAEGMDRVADASEIAVVGLTEALDILPRAAELMTRLLVECERRRPRAALLIDSPEFNLRLARKLRWLGVPVVYYVSPQIWAWRRGRVRTIAEVVDRMLVLFGFEASFYREHGVPTTHVGHPLVDEVPRLSNAWEVGRAPEPIGGARLALLPGSRRKEVESLLPSMVGAVAELRRHGPLRARLIRAGSIPRELIDRHVAGAEIEVVSEERFAAIADCHLALCASGTATLEVGLLGTPMIVLYRLSPWSYRLARWLVKVPHFSLVNLVLGRAVVPELVQDEATAGNVAARALELLQNPEMIRTMRRDLDGLREALGVPGASGRAASEVAAVLRAGDSR